MSQTQHPAHQPRVSPLLQADSSLVGFHTMPQAAVFPALSSAWFPSIVPSMSLYALMPKSDKLADRLD